MLRLTLSALAVISTAITAGYSLWAVKRIFFGTLPNELSGVTEAPWTITGPLLVLGAISLLSGFSRPSGTPAPTRGEANLGRLRHERDFGWLTWGLPFIGAILTPLFARIHPKMRDYGAVAFGFLGRSLSRTPVSIRSLGDNTGRSGQLDPEP